ncbi:ZN429 protein, partial [Crocuta crocuta]
CKQYGKFFRNISSLATHKRIHNGQKLCEHKDCKKAFNRITHFTSYQSIQAGEKLFKECDDCENVFRSHSSHGKNVNTLTEEKAYMCNECGKGFNDPSCLYRHN